MNRFVSRTGRWVVLAALISPAVKCRADSPRTVSEQPNTAVEVVANSSSDPARDTPLFKHASYPAAWTAAQESNRPILVYVSMPQCPHCAQMVEKSYGSAEIKELVKGSFESLQVGRYTHPSLVSKLHIRWYPTTVLVGSNNKVLDVIEGYVDANTLQRRLQLGIASSGASTQTR